MKRFCKLFACWVFVLLLVFSPSMQSHASLESLLIQTDSNSLMTLDLNDDDYGIMPFSTLGTVTNTVISDGIYVDVRYVDSIGTSKSEYVKSVYRDGRYHFNLILPEGCVIDYYSIQLYRTENSLPSPGNYKLSFDFTSDFAVDYRSNYLYWAQSFTDVASEYGSVTPNFETFSGDIYLSPVSISLGNVNYMHFISALKLSDSVNAIGGSFAIRFVKSDEAGSVIGYAPSSSDYQSDMSSSLSDISSSVDTMTDEISGVTEAIQNLQGVMEPHYSNVLTQLHHITEQLHAFYDQIYNNIHLKEYALWQDIKTAIENIDLEVNVNLDKLKTSIDNMSTAVQNKLQSTTDQITGGYDNAGITQENEKLEQSINQYDEVESGIFEDAEGFIGDFEYPSVDSLPLGIIKALAFVGSFLQGIFLCMGEFSVIITFSLTMIFVMVVVGYHRIRS